MQTEPGERGSSSINGSILLSLIIPSVNEQGELRKTVQEVIGNLPYRMEVILVVNGSENDTPAVARALCAEHPQVFCRVFPKRLGKGRAIVTGFDQARGLVLAFLDADGPFVPDDMKVLIDMVLNGDADCAISSKWLNKKFHEVNGYINGSNKALSRVYNLMVKTLFHVDFADTQGGFKVVSRRAWDSIDRDFVCSGYDFDFELIWKLLQQGFKVKEVFLESKNKHSGSFRGIAPLGIVANLVRMRLSTSGRR